MNNQQSSQCKKVKAMKRLLVSRPTLVVSTWAPPIVGGPQNLYNLLSLLATTSYCILTSYRSIRRLGGGTWLPAEYFFYDYFGRVQKSLHRTNRVEAASIPVQELRFAKLRRLLGNITAIGYIFGTIAAMVLAAERVIRKRDIGLILGVSDTGPALISTYLVSRLTGVPYGLYLFDLYYGNSLHPVAGLLARFFEPRLFRRARVVIVTNEATKRYYESIYPNRFRCVIVHNSAFPTDYETRRTPYKPKAPYTIVYTGNLYWAQERSLMNVIMAMDQIRDLPIRLDLYVPNATGALRRTVSSRANTTLRSAPQSEMPEIQCNATILLLPLSWHTKAPDIIATASPGKLTDYLASGRPILIHAPPYAWVSQYARENSFGLVVQEESVAQLSTAIRKLLSNVQFSRRLIENAKRSFYRNHNAIRNAKKLTRILLET